MNPKDKKSNFRAKKPMTAGSLHPAAGANRDNTKTEGHRPSADSRHDNTKTEGCRYTADSRRDNTKAGGRRYTTDNRRDNTEGRRYTTDNRRDNTEGRRPSADNRHDNAEGHRPVSANRTAPGSRRPSAARGTSDSERRPLRGEPVMPKEERHFAGGDKPVYHKSPVAPRKPQASIQGENIPEGNPDEERLQKYFTDCGVLSRRAAETEIEAGNVTVNGQKAVIGQKVVPGRDRVEWKGVAVRLPQNAEKTYIMLNKPRDYVTTMSDDKNRPCAVDLVADAGIRVYPVGRLDMESEGLLLFTNDGELANRLTHPRHEVPKVYHVKVRGEITTEQFETLGKPLVIDGYRIRPVEVAVIEAGKEYSVLQMILYEGRNRQIRKMCDIARLKVQRLIRVAMGKIELGGLEAGKWRYLNRKEMQYLTEKLGNRKETIG